MCKDNPDRLPLAVADEERLARAIFHPYHISRSGKLKPAAFKAPAGRPDVSVNRLRALEGSACKRHAKEIRSPGAFQGFAVIAAQAVRRCGSDVIDSRAYYWGHADIVHDVVLERGEPAPAEFNSRLRQMVSAARFFPDPEPGTDQWAGEDLSQES